MDSRTPPVYYQENSISGKTDPNLIARTLEERIKNLSIELLGRHNDFLVGTDEKSGFDHVFLSESNNWYGLTSYFRQMGVPSFRLCY